MIIAYFVRILLYLLLNGYRPVVQLRCLVLKHVNQIALDQLWDLHAPSAPITLLLPVKVSNDIILIKECCILRFLLRRERLQLRILFLLDFLALTMGQVGKEILILRHYSSLSVILFFLIIIIKGRQIMMNE